MKIVGNMIGCYSPMGKTFIIEDENGNEITGIVVDQETVFTATAADIVKGKVAGTDDGVVVGIHDCDGDGVYDGTYDTIATFTIRGVEIPATRYGTQERQATDGMTWREWVESEYNTDGFIIEYDYMVWYEPKDQVPCGIRNAGLDDVIVAGETYGLRRLD